MFFSKTLKINNNNKAQQENTNLLGEAYLSR